MSASYYFVHINFPFKCGVAAVPDLLRRAAAGNPSTNLRGDFIRRRVLKDHDVCLFEFEKSLAASRAKSSDFTVTSCFRDTDKILPPVREIKIHFDFTLMTVAAHE